MKKFLIIVLTILILLTVGCLDNYIPIEEYNSEVALYESQLEEANSETEAKSVEISELTEEKNTLENDLDLTEEEVKGYESLINNLNELLSCVYYGYSSNEKWISDGGFTGFSMEYKGNYYIVTAGHMVENEYGKFINFKFKSNFSDKWVYPKLLIYDNNYMERSDYAVFYSDILKNGFKIDDDNDKGEYILGNADVNINIIRNAGILSKLRESGSPIIDYEGELIGISTTDLYEFYTPIITITDAIDKIE